MIRTAVVLSPRQNANDRLYMQANGLPVDMTSASRSVVMTSHRPTQLYVASHFGQRQTAPSLTAQTGMQGQHMQRVMDQLDRQGSDSLPRFCRDGELAGEWFVAVDESRLNAVLSDRFQFFLFREQALREMRPVARLSGCVAGDAGISPAVSDNLSTGDRPAAGDGQPAVDRLPAAEGQAARSMQHFRIEIRQGDHILVMPRDLIARDLLGEAEVILQGMQQLPDRLSALSVRLRERGIEVPANGWIAMQVLRTMTEYVAPDRMPRPRFAGRRKGDAELDPGFSEAVADPDAATARAGDSGAAHPLRRLTWVTLLVGLAIVIAVAGFMALRPKAEEPTETTPATTPPATMATTARPTPSPVPTNTPAVSTAPRISWYVAAQRLNLRAAPETAGTLIRTLRVGQVVYVLEQTSKDWARVETPEGETGYVYSAYIGKDKPGR